jgi:hypothetical protein
MKKTVKKYQSAGTIVAGRSATKKDAMKEFMKGSNKPSYSNTAQADSAIKIQKANIDSAKASKLKQYPAKYQKGGFIGTVSVKPPQPPAKEKTKVGKVIEKAGNLFNKKSDETKSAPRYKKGGLAKSKKK